MLKKNLLYLLLMFGLIGFSQTNTTLPKNEIRLDGFSLIALKYIDVSYERFINEEAAYGVNVQFTLDDTQEDLGIVRTFSLTPFYRQYFSKKYAKGFFIEGFATYARSKEYVYLDYLYNDVTDTYTDIYDDYDYNVFALGLSVGGKFVTNRGFVTEIFLGIGRNLLDVDDYYVSDIVGRGGIAIGYRF